jgi:hypothetical protein
MDSKSNNLERQYQEVIAYIETYVAFVEGIAVRVKQSKPKNLSAWQRLTLDPLKLPDSVIAAIPAFATDDEKQHVFYQVILSDDPTDRLSEALRTEFAQLEFAKVKRLHDLNQPKAGGPSNMSNLVGLVLAIVGGILRSISPSPGAEPSQHTLLERITFWVIVAGLVYLLIVLVPKWFRHARRKEAHNFADYVLTYTYIQLDQ